MVFVQTEESSKLQVEQSNENSKANVKQWNQCKNLIKIYKNESN